MQGPNLYPRDPVRSGVASPHRVPSKNDRLRKPHGLVLDFAIDLRFLQFVGIVDIH
jgi:hypothetical protein